MTNSKLIFSLGVLVFVVIAGTSYAQDNSQKDITKQEVKTYKLTPEEQATKITDRLNKELNLTSEQYTKIQKLYADPYIKDRKGIFEFILGGSTNTQLLDVRVFDDATKRTVYKTQTIKAEKKKISNCSHCAIGHEANKSKI